MSTREPKIPKVFAHKVTRSIMDSLIEQGDIDPRGKTAEQLSKELLKINKNAEWVLIVDHTQDWLNRARQASKEGDLSFSVVCYAIWLEHQINKMVASLGKRHGLSEKLIDGLIRHTSTAEKFVWIQLVLTSKPPVDSCLNRLQRLVEARNQYVHYKWKPKKEEAEKLLESIVANAEKSVAEMRKFSNRHFFHNQKKRVSSLFSRKSKKSA
jgi:hypothetical protein